MTTAAYNKAYREANLERIHAYDKARYEANKELRAEKAKAYRKANKEHVSQRDSKLYHANKERYRAYALARKYRMTVEELTALYDLQNGQCAICQNAIEKLSAHVDHCHASGKVRGLLCSKCNKGIGLLSDDPSIVLRAYTYLSTQGVNQ